MNRIRRTLRIAGIQFMHSFSTPRYIIAFMAEIVYGMYYIIEYSRYASQLNNPVNVMEGYMCIASSEYTITVLVLLFIFAVSDVPFTGKGSFMERLRTDKKEWVTGKLLYISATAVLMQLILLLMSVVMLCNSSFLNNAWSFPFTILVRGQYISTGVLDYQEIGVLVAMKPFGAAAGQAGLICMYMIFLGILLFAISAMWSKTVAYVAVAGIHIAGFSICLSSIKTLFLPFPNAILPMIYSGGRNGSVLNSVIYFVTLIAAAAVVLYFLLDKKEIRQD